MKYYNIAAVLFLLVLTGCSVPKATVTPGQASAVKPLTDAALKEKMVYNERTGFGYAIEHDKDNLIIYLTAEDQNLQRKMAYFGFTVWIDRTGGKNREQGFRHPLGLNMDHYRPEDIESALKLAGDVELIGIYGSSSRIVKMRDSRVRINTQIIDGLLFYRAVVPFELLRSGYDPVGSGSRLSIGLETGYLVTPRDGGRQMPQDGRMTGSGMGPRGGRPGAMMPGQGYRMPERGYMPAGRMETNELSKASSLWIDLEF
jgi:hypothetical protein